MSSTSPHPVHEYLRRHLITQRQVALDLGYAPEYVCEVIGGRRRATPEFRRQVAQYLGAEEKDLFASEEAEWESQILVLLTKAPPAAQRQAARLAEALRAA